MLEYTVQVEESSKIDQIMLLEFLFLNESNHELARGRK